ncbi:MAG: hypothetical protein ACR2LI_15940 [Propionibacteriaceae bacterium]
MTSPQIPDDARTTSTTEDDELQNASYDAGTTSQTGADDGTMVNDPAVDPTDLGEPDPED